MDNDKPADRPAAPPPRPSMWARVRPHFTPQRFIGALVIAVIAAVAAVVVAALIPDDEPPPVSPSSATRGESAGTERRAPEDPCTRAVTESSLLTEEEALFSEEEDPPEPGAMEEAKEVCRRPFWTETPTLSSRSFNRARDADFVGLSAELDGEVEALSVEKLVQESAEYSGLPVYVVGRVRRNNLVSPSVSDEIDREIRLQGRDPTYAVMVGTTDSLIEVPEGDVVAAQGFVAARGVARFTGSGRTIDTAYFLSDEVVDPTNLDSKAIRAQVRRLDK